MSTERTFSWSMHSEAVGEERLVLRLLDDGTFFFLTGTYSNSWGELEEDSTRYSGTYEDRGGQIICHATQIKRTLRSEDRDWGKKEKSIKRSEWEETFVFSRAEHDEALLVCPEEGFQRRELRADSSAT